MVLVLQISESNSVGGLETVTDGVGSYNYGSTDAPNIVAAAAPVTIHPSDVKYSYEKYNRFKCLIGTGGTKIDNMRFWKQSGDYKTGESLFLNLTTARVIPNVWAIPVNTLSTKAVNAFPVAEPAKNVFTPQGAGNDEVTPALPYTDFITWQARIASTAGGSLPGAVPQKVFRVQYDEQ